MARNLRDVTTMALDTAVFAEQAIVYTHMTAGWEGRRHVCTLTRVSFCRHAVERLVERGTAPLDRPLLPALDAEAARMVRHLLADRTVEHDGDLFVAGAEEGLWAGSLDCMAAEPEWPLHTPDAMTSVFSARTFLGPDQIRPMVWLRWKGQGA